MEYLGIAIAVIVVLGFIGLAYRLISRKDAARLERLHRRSANLRANAQRVHEQQETLRQQQRQQRP